MERTARLVSFPLIFFPISAIDSHRWEYIPFSGGPRVCIGQQFALTQMGYFLVRLFQTFDSIEARDDLPMQQEMMISLKLANDLWVGLKRA